MHHFFRPPDNVRARFSFSILYIRRVKHRETVQLAQGHVATSGAKIQSQLCLQSPVSSQNATLALVVLLTSLLKQVKSGLVSFSYIYSCQVIKNAEVRKCDRHCDLGSRMSTTPSVRGLEMAFHLRDLAELPNPPQTSASSRQHKRTGLPEFCNLSNARTYIYTLELTRISGLGHLQMKRSQRIQPTVNFQNQ